MKGNRRFTRGHFVRQIRSAVAILVYGLPAMAQDQPRIAAPQADWSSYRSSLNFPVKSQTRSPERKDCI